MLDVALRDDVVPYLDSTRGLVDVHAGRHVSSEAGDRILVTTWTTHSAMAAALGTSGDVELLLADHADDVLDARIEALELAFGVRLDRHEPARVLRVVRGTVRDGDLEAYVEEHHERVLRDVRMFDGMLAVHVGVERPVSFVTVSVWADWASIELATGATVQHPAGGREASGMLTAEATYYEILPAEQPADRPEVGDLSGGR